MIILLIILITASSLKANMTTSKPSTELLPKMIIFNLGTLRENYSYWFLE